MGVVILVYVCSVPYLEWYEGLWVFKMVRGVYGCAFKGHSVCVRGLIGVSVQACGGSDISLYM